MNLWESLLQTYEKFEKSGKVGVKLEQSTARVLPVFHNDRTISNNDKAIEIILDEKSNFVTVTSLSKDSYVIFPVTLDSVSRSSGITPHPLLDDLQYLSTEFDSNKYDEYIKQLKSWVEFSKVKELHILYNYITRNTIINDIKPLIDEKYIDKKTFVTFSIKMNEDYWTPTDSTTLQNDFIEFINHSLLNKEQGVCAITGKKMFLSDKHRGLLGTAKMISVSNNPETYSGRIKDKSKVSFLGYETSEKIFLMLRYLLSQRNYTRFIGDATYLVAWDGNLEEESINLTSQVEQDDFDSSFSGFDDLEFPMQKENNYILNPVLANERMKYLTGFRAVNKESDYFVLIVNKISNGRLSIKYFRNFSGSELNERILKWYQTTSWPVWTKNGVQEITLGLNSLVQRIIGTETKDKRILSRNESLNRWYIEKLLMSILEGNTIPLDLITVVRANIMHKERYVNTWQQLETASLSMIKKYYHDYRRKTEKEGVSALLENNYDRSYLFGRLMAVTENIEQLSMGDYNRATLITKFWHQLCVRPQSAYSQVKTRMIPYENRLKKSKPGAFFRRDQLIQEIYSELDTNSEYLSNPNKPLSELFLVGYYAQKSALSNVPKNDKNEEEIVENDITE